MEYATETGSVTFESLWKTRHDNLVPVCDMESDHLLNTVHYLEGTIEQNRGEPSLAVTDLPRTMHNIEVLRRELLRRTETDD